MLKSTLLAAACAAVLAAPALADGRITEVINGRVVTFERSPIVVQNQYMVPVESTYRSLGGTVVSNNGQFILRRANQIARITLGSRLATLNGEPVTLSVAPTRVNGEILVPMDFACMATGTDLTYIPSAAPMVVYGANPVLRPVTIMPAHPLGVFGLAPLPGTAVPEKFYLEGHTAPYAAVCATEMRAGEGSGAYYHNVTPQDFYATADDLGHFSIQVDTSHFASGTPLVMRVRARDEAGVEGPTSTLELVRQ